ncbi:MAG: TetR/AcrR family transcriptional regulator [Bacteroidia bacterium]
MRKTKADTEKTIDYLLDSAIKLFIRHGYSAVTLEQIAAGIGMTRGAFYHHFSSKEDILNALIKRERNSFEGKLGELFLVKSEPEKKLRLILDHIVNNFFDNKRFNRFIQFTWFKIESSLIENKFFYQGATNERLVVEIEKIIRNGQRSGAFGKRVSAKISALGITTGILGMYRLYFQSRSQMTKKNALKMMRNYIEDISQ